MANEKYEKSMQDSINLYGWTREELEIIHTLSSFRKKVFRKLTENGFIRLSYREFLKMIEVHGIEETLVSLEKEHSERENNTTTVF